MAVAVDGDETQVRSYPSSLGGHMEQAGYEAFLALDLAGAAPRVAAEAAALLTRTRVPGRDDLADPRRRAARRSAARVDRARRRARPRARARGLVRGHELRAGRRDRLAALRLRARQRHRRRDASRRPGLLRLGRRGRGEPQRPDRARGRAGGLPLLARDRRGARPRPLGRLHARRRLRPPADRAHDQRQPRARRGRHARGPDRRHRARPADRHQPLVVDRRPAPALPLRGRGRASRSSTAAWAGCCATRATPA